MCRASLVQQAMVSKDRGKGFELLHVHRLHCWVVVEPFRDAW